MFLNSRALDSFDQYLFDVEKYPLIEDPEEERELARRAREGDKEAAERLVTANLRFVISYVKKYQGRGLGLAELVCIGNEGLLKAVKKFDPDKGVKFISYAVWWIRQAILQALAEQSRIFRVPLNRASTLHRIGRKRSLLLQELGREPTVEEVADELDLGQQDIEHSLSLAQSHLSLDAAVAPGHDGRLLDYIPDVFAEPPDSETYSRALSRTIEEALSTISEREARILRLYFGIDGEEPKTLEEIGAILGITRERVRQIKERALDRMRHASRARLLDAFHT